MKKRHVELHGQTGSSGPIVTGFSTILMGKTGTVAMPAALVG